MFSSRTVSGIHPGSQNLEAGPRESQGAGLVLGEPGRGLSA